MAPGSRKSNQTKINIEIATCGKRGSVSEDNQEAFPSSYVMMFSPVVNLSRITTIFEAFPSCIYLAQASASDLL